MALKRHHLVLRPRPPAGKKSALVVNSQTPRYATKSREPFGTAIPTSGLKRHRLVPRLTNFVPSYCRSAA